MSFFASKFQTDFSALVSKMCQNPCKVSESKQLLEIIGNSIGQGLDYGVELYEKYLLHARHFKLDLQGLLSSEPGSKTILNTLYASDCPEKDPKYFSIYNPDCLTTLQQHVLTDHELIILYTPKNKNVQDGDYLYLFDGRVATMRRETSNFFPIVILLHPEISPRLRSRRLSRMSDNLVNRLQSGILNPIQNITGVKTFEAYPTLGCVFAAVLKIPEMKTMTWEEIIIKLPDLPSSEESVLILCYYGSNMTGRVMTQQRKAESAHYHSWGEFFTGKTRPEKSKTFIISPLFPLEKEFPKSGNYAVGLWTLEAGVEDRLRAKTTPKPYELPTLDSATLESVGTGQKKRRDNARIQVLMNRKFQLEDERQTLVQDWMESQGDETLLEDERPDRLVEVNDEIDRLDVELDNQEYMDFHYKVSTERWSCSCPYCSSAFLDDGFRDASDTGPERPVHTELDSDDFLHLLNMNTPENVEAIRKATRYSTCSFDIETFSSYDKGNLSSALRVNPVSTTGCAEPISATLVPVMMGFGCETLPASEELHYKSFDVHDDELNERPMMERFLEHVFYMRGQLENAKREVLRPLLNHLTNWRDAHLLFYEQEGWTDILLKDRIQAFNRSPPGLFLAKLERMTKTCYVYSYNGASFDHICILPSLACYIKTHFPKARVTTQSDGLKIKKITAKNVVFTDAKFYLSAGASLAQMLKTVLNDKDSEKAIFPHGLFTNREFLKQASLPADAAAWKDPLRPDVHPTQAAVDEAIVNFRRQGCKTIGEIEHYYMYKDVTLLQKALYGLFDAFKEIIGLDAIDVRKMSISSLSSAGVMKWLRKKKSYAYFSPNCKPLLKALVDSSTGGLCQVLESRGFASTKDSLDPDNLDRPKFDKLWNTLEKRNAAGDNNLFVEPDGEEAETNVKCFDVASLYPASGKILSYCDELKRVQKKG